MSLLEVRNLSISVRRGTERLPAVNGVSFAVERGEIVGLGGESGSGKSLTALSIPGLLPQAAEISGGEIAYNGRPLSSLDEKSLCRIRGKEIAMIFQESRQSLNPLMRLGDQIAEPLELHSLMKKKEARLAAAEILAKLRLPEKVLDAKPHELSGGMCQRVMIAIAAVCGPALLIADEPSAALDKTSEEHIFALLEEINRGFGTAIFFISHDLGAVRRFCSRFIVMYGGKIVEEGPVEAVFSSPAHPYTRGLIGAIPGKDKRGKALANIPGQAPAIEDRLSGCPFAPRCPRREEKCLSHFPAALTVGRGHSAHCFLYGNNP
jgi:peptide/nickel transport system ATP-binding protein